MGDFQSTQRGSRQDPAAEEESREGDNPRSEQNTKHETFKNSEQSSDVSRKGDEVKMNGCHEDENGAQGLPLIPAKEAAPETQGNEEKPQGEVDVNDGVHLEITELDVKQNDINSLGRFFSNIGLKLTINRGSGEKVKDDKKETNTQQSEETKTEKTNDRTQGDAEQDSSDPKGPISTAVTSENVLENADKTAETTEEPELKAESGQEPLSTNPTGPIDVDIDSPVRRFFATGIFAGLWKKKEAGDDTTEKELEEIRENQVAETTGQTAQEPHDEEATAPGELREEFLAKSHEPDIVGSQERDRVQMSPLIRLLSGSSLKRLSMKQRSIKSSDARLCDSGEHPAELLPSEPAEDHRNASAPTSAEVAWASFKRFMSPKPRMKKSYHSAEETQQPASVEEPRAEQTSDHSSEESKKRKNSSVSWEAVLCGSGRRRSRRTSDSEDEMPPIDSKYHKEDVKPKSGEESGAENEKGTTSAKLDGSPQEDDGGSTWKSLKRIVTPKRKSRDEDEAGKIKIQSDGEGGQENSSFSIKNLLPGRKKQRSEESQGGVSSDEVEKDLASDDEDSETPGVIPLSEFEVNEEENKNLGAKEKLELQQDQGADVNLCYPQDFDEDSEKQDTNERPDDVTELSSKDQQLSDIPEEGVIKESWATLAWVTEEVEGRDDTMVEDLIEVTSEAITAPEPAADLTLQDETEMFTAATQFSSESATTSGNATPVPAEHDIVETDAVLHQLAETFSTSPQTTTPEPEQTSEGCVKKESTVLETYRRPDTTSTGLNGEDLEALSGLVSASLREGISEVAEFKSVGFRSEVAEEFDSTVEDEERPSTEEEDVQDLAKEPAEALASEGGNETGEKEIREAGNEMIPLTEANVDAEDAKHVQEPEMEGPVEGAGPSPEPKVIYDNISMCLGTEPGEEKPGLETCLVTEVILEQLDAKNVEEPDLQAEEASSLNHQEGRTSPHKPPMISENPAPAEKDKDEDEDEKQILTETAESAEAPQELEVLRAVQELSSNVREVGLPYLETEFTSSETFKEINVSDDIMKLQDLNDGIGRTEDSCQLVEASKSIEEPEVSQTASSLASAKSNVPSVDTEQKADNIPKEEMENKIQTMLMVEDTSEPLDDGKNVCMAVDPKPEESEHLLLVKEVTCVHASKDEPVPDEPKQETILIDTKLQSLDSSETVQEAQASQVQPLESIEPETRSEIILTDEAVPDERKEQVKLHREITLEPEDPSETDLEAEVLKVLQQSLESEGTKEEPSDNITGEETVLGEPSDETTVADETSSEPVDDSKTFEVKELETVETSSFMPEKSRSTLTAEETSESIPKEELDTVENQVETVFGMVVASEAKPAEEPELSKTVQMSSLESEDNRIHSAEEETTSPIILTEETIPDEPGDETTAAGESRSYPVDDTKTTEVVEEGEPVETSSLEPPDGPQNVEGAELSLTVQPSSEETKNIHVSSLEEEEISEHTPKAETVPHEPNKEKILDPEDLETEELESEHLSLVKEVTRDHASEDEPVPDEPKQETILSDIKPQSVDPSETVEEAEVSQVSQQSESEESKEEPPDNITEEETVPGEPRDETTLVGETSNEPVDDSKTVEVVEIEETVERSSFISEGGSRSTLKAEETSENIQRADLDRDECKVETVLITEEPEFSQTVEASSGQSEDNSVPSAEPEMTSEIILTEETFTGEPREKLKLHSEITLESEQPSETGGEAQVLKDVPSQSESEESRGQSPKREVTSDISEETTDKPRRETTGAGETSSEPVDDSDTVQVVEEAETSSLVREESKISSYEPEESSENTESDQDKNKAETILHTEYLTESEDSARVLKESEELKTVLQAESQTRLKQQTAVDEPEDVKRGDTESLFEKVDDFKTLQMSSFESEESSTSSSGPEASSENVFKADLDTNKQETQTTFITEDTSEPPDDPQNVEGAELSPNVQPSSEETKNIHLSSLEEEEMSEHTSKAETVPHEPNKEKILDPEDLETEELESEHPSLVKEVTRDHASEDEPVPDEPKQETILSDIKPQSVDPSETVEEAEVSQVSQQSESEESKEEPPDNITEEETVPGEPRDETTLVGETSNEPVDDSKTVEVIEIEETVERSSFISEGGSRSTLKAEETSENIQRADLDRDECKVETVLITEEPEFSQTVEASSGESEDNSFPSAEPEMTSEIILTEETFAGEPREKLKLHREITLEYEKTSETGGEAQVLKDVPSQSESEESRGQSPKREVTSDISEETTDKPRRETTGAGETSSEPVNDSKTAEVVEGVEPVETSSLEPPDDPQNVEGAELSLTLQPSSEETKNIHVSSLEEEEISEHTPKAETVPHEPNKEKILDPEDLETEELESEHLSLVKEVTCDHASKDDPVPDEPKEETNLSDIKPQSADPSETVEEAEVSQVPSQSESEESRGQSPKREVTSDISEETTDKPRRETTGAGETSSEPVDDSKTAEVVGVETVGTSSFMSEESSKSTLTAEETSENIPKEELDAVENQVEAVLGMVVASEAKPAEEPELSQTVQVPSLESEDNRIHSAEAETTSPVILTEETIPDEPGDETTAAGESRREPVDDTKTTEVVEEVETEGTSSLVREESNFSPYEPEQTSKNILKAESEVGENKVETSFVLEEQPEFSPTVQSSPFESEDNSIHSEDIKSVIILTEETGPDEPGDEKAASGEAIYGQETKGDVKERQNVQISSQDEYKCSSPPLEAKERADVSKAETVSDETKEEITLDPENTKSADESEEFLAANATPESEHPSLAKEVTCLCISGEMMIPDEQKEETINEILDTSTPVQELERTQDLLVPSLDSGELERKSNNVAKAETDTVLLSEVRFKPVDIQEPEVLKTVQAASFESVEVSDETQVTLENFPKAEPAPQEEDLTVETTDDLKTEEKKEDKCSGTKRETVEDEDPAAPHMDKCHPKDVSEAAPELLREQASEALKDTMSAEQVVKEQAEGARPSVRDGVTEEVEGGKAEDTAVVDADTTPEGTTVDSGLEVEEMAVKDAMDVCCRVGHEVENLSANKELEKEQILKEDEAKTQEEKVHVDDEVEKKESTVQATEEFYSPAVTKAKEVDQDEWMDAEDNIDIQEETAGSVYEVEEPLGSQRRDEDKEQAGLEGEVETAQASKVEGEGSEEVKKEDEACGFESEEEDFEVALEHPGNTSSSAVSLTG